MPMASAAASRPGAEVPTEPAGTPGTAAVGQALPFDDLGHAVRQLVDGRLEPLGGGGDDGVDHGLHVDAVRLGDLRDRLAVLEGRAQLVLGDADGLGGDRS